MELKPDLFATYSYQFTKETVLEDDNQVAEPKMMEDMESR